MHFLVKLASHAEMRVAVHIVTKLANLFYGSDYWTAGTPTLGNSEEPTASSFSLLVTPRIFIIRYIEAGTDN